MPVMIFTMLVVLLLAAAVIAVVVMGMEGTGRQQHPEIADAMARTARHLNGEGEPPRALTALFDEIDEVPELNVRELPGKLRSLGTAASAASARSARTAWSALSARSATSANPPEVGDAEAPGEDAAGEDASVWAPDAPSASPTDDVDADAAAAVAAALAAPLPDPAADDPYGLWGATELADAADGSGLAPEDAVVRVSLPGQEGRG